MTQKLNPNQVRQGDVLLVRVRHCDKHVAPTAQPVVLAHGEVTGHKHQFMAESRVSYLGRENGVTVASVAELVHEEHSTALLMPGIYDMPTQVEWTDEMEPRAVAD